MNRLPDHSDSMSASQAAALLAEVDAHPTIVNISNAARALGGRAGQIASVRLRLACLSSFTFEPLKAALVLQGLRAGFAIEPFVAPFGQFDRELIDPASSLTAFNPDAVLVAIRLPDVAAALFDSFTSLSSVQAEAIIHDWLARLRSALLTFRQRSQAQLLIQNYDLPAYPALGIADRSAPNSQTALIRRANDALATMAAEIPNAYLMDYDALVAQEGRRNWADPRMVLHARILVAPANYWRLAGFYVRHLRPLYGLTKKVLVLDADNTLWGGVVGDVGLGGIALGPDYPGNAYVALQRRVLDLHRRGIVLCLASKNEPGSVEEVLEKHPAMVLRKEHFSAMRVNWQAKHENIQAMARDLNLGLESFVFVDDSPVECDLMRSAIPQMTTICLQKEPAEFPGVVESLDCFDQWRISTEDRQRGVMYRAEAGRRELQAEAVDMPTFYRRLQMQMMLSIDDPSDIARAAQMASRTNQFNMHTLRYSEDDIRRFVAAEDHHVITLALTDRFGDNGIVGLAVVRKGTQQWMIHVLLMSCRILGRTVEQCFLKWIAAQAKEAGAKRLAGEFVPTPKNKPFAEFYPSCGFVAEPPEGDVQRWLLRLADADTTIPDWMTIVVNDKGQCA